jgi:hypothetical protein
MTQDADSGPPGVSAGVAVGILAGVLALGLVAVFTIGQTKSSGTTLAAKPGSTATVPGYTPGATPTAAAGTPTAGDTSTGSAGTVPTDTATADAGGSGGTTGGGSTATPTYTSEFSVGECVDTSGSDSSFTVNEAGCSNANYKIIYAFQNESGNVNNDMSQCYTINGNDNEFENGDAADGYTLYCMNSLTGDYSPRRAGVNNCLDSSGTYEVNCTSSSAKWIVIGRLNGTTNTKGCSQFGSYDTSYYWTSSPAFVLCVDKYSH